MEAPTLSAAQQKLRRVRDLLLPGLYEFCGKQERDHGRLIELDMDADYSSGNLDVCAALFSGSAWKFASRRPVAYKRATLATWDEIESEAYKVQFSPRLRALVDDLEKVK